MLSTSNYQREEGVIRSGEVIEPEYSDELLKDPNTTVYYHQIKGARFVMPDGAEIRFTGGMFATRNPDLKKELDKVANGRGTMIYTKKEVADAYKKEAEQAAEDARKPASEANQIGGNAVSVKK